MARIGMGERVVRVYRYEFSEQDIVRMIVIVLLVISCTVPTGNILYPYPRYLVLAPASPHEL
jgi:hypothetical protein